MGNLNTERDAFWPDMYVLLSRATRMEDRLIFRCPPKSFFDNCPPPSLKKYLKELHSQGGPIAHAREKADEFIAKFGWCVAVI